MSTSQLTTHSVRTTAADAEGLYPQLRVSVVVPMFNERECVDQLCASLEKLERELAPQFEFEFVLVDDGSSDGTAELLESALVGRANYRIVRHGANRGIAAAIQTGLREAQHETVVSMDSDGSYD